MPSRPNVLLITLDQFRGDCTSAAGHPMVRTPALDELAAQGVRLARHHSQAAPCGPGRAALYTGTYQLNNRVVANGTPLDARFDNLALAARRAGYRPALFGYTDQAVDPREVSDPHDPRLDTYEGILPGLDPELLMIQDQNPWREWLGTLGHTVPADAHAALVSEPDRPAEHSLAAFVTDRLVDWIDRQDEPWFAHLSHLRPHPPYAAAGHFAQAHDPADVPAPISVPTHRHPLLDGLLRHRATAAPQDPDRMRRIIAQYYGMIEEVDHQLGRLWAALRRLGQWDDTVVIVTSDHGEQLGDHGLLQKGGLYGASYHVLGVIRDPRTPAGHGTVVDRFTENVDVFPTLCELIGVPVPAQCDGLPLTPFLRGEEPPHWREAAHWEFDWRSVFLEEGGTDDWPWDRSSATHHLAVRRDERSAYVHFGDGSWRCFDLAADPTWHTETHDPAIVLPAAQAMLTWRATNTDRTLADTLVDHGLHGRDPRADATPTATATASPAVSTDR